jgi:hypothetical protein
MRLKKKLIFCMAILTLCVSAFGHVGYPWSADKKIPESKPSRALANVNKMYVFLVASEPNDYATLWDELDKKVAGKLEVAGIKVLEPGTKADPNEGINELRIQINLLKAEGQIVFNVRTSLAVTAYTPKYQAVSYVEIWQISALEAVAEEEMSGGIEAVVLGQVDKFIKAKKAAGSLKVTSSERLLPMRLVSAVSNEEKAVPAVSATSYLASKSGKVYHKQDCTMAKTIKAENLVMYGSKEQAERDGKRPCKICKP